MGYNKLMKILLLFIFSLLLFGSAPKNLDLYKKVFKSYSKSKVHKTVDRISEFKTNKTILEALDSSGKRLGFIREVNTSTGCNDGCLPVIFTLFYDSKGQFLRLLSKEGLTKKDHEEFGEFDYLNLETIIRKNPPVFKKVGHPSEMVDAITRATLKVYKAHVIERAAYTTLRVNLYNQDTLNFINESILKTTKN